MRYHHGSCQKQCFVCRRKPVPGAQMDGSQLNTHAAISLQPKLRK